MKVSLLHTVKSVYNGFPSALRAEYEGNLIINSMLDEFLVTNAEKKGFFPPENRRKLYLDLLSLSLEEPDVICVTCSSLTPYVEEIKTSFDIPIVCIDDEMCYLAVKNYKKIGVVATAPTTVEPTVGKLKNEARKQNKDVVIESLLLASAMTELKKGNVEEHNRIIAEGARKFSAFDCIVLSQASMETASNLTYETVQKPVLTSPKTCIDKVLKVLKNV